MAVSGMGLIFPLYLKVLLSETTGPIILYYGRNAPLVTFYQDCSNRHDSSRNVAARGLVLVWEVEWVRGGGGRAYFLYISVGPISI